MFLHEASPSDHGMHRPVARKRWLRLGMRLAAGVGAEKAARGEGIERSVVDSLLLDPDFRSLKHQMAVLLNMHEDVRRQKLEEMAFAVLMRALAADDLRAAAFVMASQRNGEDPSSRLARTFWSRAKPAATPSSTPAAEPAQQTSSTPAAERAQQDKVPETADHPADAAPPGSDLVAEPASADMAVDRLLPPPPPVARRRRREWPAARAMRRGVAALCGELREEVIVRAPDEAPRPRPACDVASDRDAAGATRSPRATAASTGEWPGAARVLKGLRAELLRSASYGPFFLSRHFDRLRRWYARHQNAMKLGP